MHLPSQMFFWIRIITPIEGSKLAPCTQTTPTCSQHRATSLRFCLFLFGFFYFGFCQPIPRQRNQGSFVELNSCSGPGKCRDQHLLSVWGGDNAFLRCSLLLTFFLKQRLSWPTPQIQEKILRLSESVKRKVGIRRSTKRLHIVTIRLSQEELFRPKLHTSVSTLQCSICVVR